MDVTPLIPVGRQIIQQYRAGGFRVSGKNYDGAIIVLPTQTLIWPVTGDLSLSSFQILMPFSHELVIVLLGTGAVQQFIAPSLRQALKQQGLPLDVMDTGAACRTYNVLMAEGRRIAAAMLPC